MHTPSARWGLAATLALLAIVAVYAAKTKIEETGVEIPGVDEAGDLSPAPDFAGEGDIRATLNNKTGDIRAKIKGDVTNASGATQNFPNTPEIDDLVEQAVDNPQITPRVESSRYKVSKKGKAKGSAAGSYGPQGPCDPCDSCGPCECECQCECALAPCE